MAAITLAGCRDSVPYSHYEHIEIDGWERTDTLKFRIADIIADGDYDEVIGMRIDGSYPFTSVTLIAEQHSPSYGLLRTDTLECRLTDNEANFTGTGSTYLSYEFPLATLRLQQADTLDVKLYHTMLRQSLNGITDVGLTLRKVSH